MYLEIVVSDSVLHVNNINKGKHYIKAREMQLMVVMGASLIPFLYWSQEKRKNEWSFC